MVYLVRILLCLGYLISVASARNWVHGELVRSMCDDGRFDPVSGADLSRNWMLCTAADDPCAVRCRSQVGRLAVDIGFMYYSDSIIMKPGGWEGTRFEWVGSEANVSTTACKWWTLPGSTIIATARCFGGRLASDTRMCILPHTSSNFTRNSIVAAGSACLWQDFWYEQAQGRGYSGTSLLDPWHVMTVTQRALTILGGIFIVVSLLLGWCLIGKACCRVKWHNTPGTPCRYFIKYGSDRFALPISAKRASATARSDGQELRIVVKFEKWTTCSSGDLVVKGAIYNAPDRRRIAATQVRVFYRPPLFPDCFCWMVPDIASKASGGEDGEVDADCEALLDGEPILDL